MNPHRIAGTAAAAAVDTAAELRQASKQYGGPGSKGTVTALDQLDFAVRPGEVVALLGPNGAGKTTTVQLLLGLARPTSGQALLFGRDPKDAAARMRVGAMLQVSKVPETLKVREHIHLISSYYPRPLPPGEVIEIAGLAGLEERPYGKLSGGQKQRVLFALAVCGDPDLLFLDEPTTGLDVEARRGLWSAIRELVRRGRTVLLTTHHLEEADSLASRIVVLDRGRVAAEGTPAEIKARVGGRRIRCATRIPIEDLLRLPGVVTARREGALADLSVTRAEAAVAELLRRDPDLSGLEVLGAGLEEAFLALTNHPNGEEKAA
jgi:ABC-2 type transport system ATP-binding protein